MYECYNMTIITNKTKIMRKKDTKKKKWIYLSMVTKVVNDNVRMNLGFPTL